MPSTWAKCPGGCTLGKAKFRSNVYGEQVNVDKRRLESIYRIRTPEYVEFEFPLAGLMSRILAWLVDISISSIAAYAVIMFVITIGALGSLTGFATAIAFVVWFLASWCYLVFLEYRWNGQTIGKKIFGLRVIQQSGVRIGFYHSAVRNLIRPLDHLPLLYLVGGTLSVLSESSQRLGDLAAGTVVVKDRRSKIPQGLVRPTDPVPVMQVMRDNRLRERILRATVEEREVLIAAALRREDLSLEVRLNLFHALSHYLQERFNFFKPVHLSDEKLVVGIVNLIVETDLPERRSFASKLR